MSTPEQRNVTELTSIARTTLLMLVITWFGHLGAQLPELSVDSALSLIPGLIALFLIVMLGYLAAILIPSRLPDIFWISIVATLVGIPGLPWSEMFIGSISKLSFVAMITPVLSFVALSLTAREVALFRKTGLQITFISILVFSGTFVGSALVAHGVLLITG